MDPHQIVEIRELISSLRESHTVILSSHILSEVQEVSDMILVIRHGKTVACDTPENLEKLLAPKAQVEAVVEGTEEQVRTMVSEAFGADEIESVTEKNGAWEVTVSSAEADSQELARRLQKAAVSKDLMVL